MVEDKREGFFSTLYRLEWSTDIGLHNFDHLTNFTVEDSEACFVIASCLCSSLFKFSFKTTAGSFQF
jgi:hypothetical protein